MLTSRDLVIAARTALGLPSNYALSKALDVRESDISRWHNMRHAPTDAMTVRLATIAGIDPAAAVAAMHAQQCGDDEIRPFLEAIARRAALAACVILSVGFGAAPEARAEGTNPCTLHALGSVYYVKLRRWIDRLTLRLALPI